MRYLLAIDDTDSLTSRGTGYQARRLGAGLTESGLATVEAVTRHQLLVDPRIPFTSHNSSACLTLEADPARFDLLVEYARNFLLAESAPEADVGLCLVEWSMVGPAISEFGHRAKQQVLTLSEARALAHQENILLEGLTGNHGGMIGALAAVGLRANGQDGRFIWLPGLRELDGVYTADRLFEVGGIDTILSLNHAVVPPDARIDVGGWCRPIMRDGQAVLLVEAVQNSERCDWRVAPKETVKQF